MFAFGSASPVRRVPAAARVGVAALALSPAPLPARSCGWPARRIRTRPRATSATSRAAPCSGARRSTARSAGPRRPGRGWLLRVTNVSVTPYTYADDFMGDDAVLSRDNLKIAFRVHTVWRVDDQRVPLFMERFSTTVTDRRTRRTRTPS